jgi:hypothetical protein
MCDWAACMRRGDFAAAWAVSDRLRRAGITVPHSSVPRHLQSVWDGSPFDGAHVLVRCYHGLGDTIQFIRYMSLLRARARHVTVWAQPGLMALLRGVRGIDRLLPLHDGVPPVDYDVDIEVMELPWAFRTTLDTIPNAVPYIEVQPLPLEATGKPAVGLVWRAGDWDCERSIPFARLSPLFDRAGSWYIVQRGSGAAECPADFGYRRTSDDIVDTARLIKALDLLISVDSMPAHLAGAIGTPVWTLLNADPDWRWMDAGDCSPWYPSMRLFRQQRKGDWDPVIASAAAALESFGRT